MEEFDCYGMKPRQYNEEPATREPSLSDDRHVPDEGEALADKVFRRKS